MVPYALRSPGKQEQEGSGPPPADERGADLTKTVAPAPPPSLTLFVVIVNPAHSLPHHTAKLPLPQLVDISFVLSKRFQFLSLSRASREL